MKATDTITNVQWTIDQPHSEIDFKIRHLMISNVKGSFKTFDASIYTYDKDFTTAEIDLWIDVASLDTGDVQRDGHLKSVEFFDVENHRQITFVSNTIGAADIDGKHELWGDLTIKGVTKNIKLNVLFGGIVTDPWGKEKAGFTVSGKINRNDFGLTWNAALEAGGLMVSEEVSISCDIELVHAGEKGLPVEAEESAVIENLA